MESENLSEKQLKKGSKESKIEARNEKVRQRKRQSYTERKLMIEKAINLASYPLQFLSVVFGTYLLTDTFVNAFHVELNGFWFFLILGISMLAFTALEVSRRYLLDQYGNHYIATTEENSQEHQRFAYGEHLKGNRVILISFSLLTIFSGTYGTYQLTKDIAPEAPTIEMEEKTSPIAQKIQRENESIRKLDKEISDLKSQKQAEKNDKKNTAIWKGKEYLLPKAEARLVSYDKQIQSLMEQRQVHLSLLSKLEGKLDNTEVKTEKLNQEIIEVHSSNTYFYAGLVGTVWFFFEILLVYFMSYTWVFEFGIKKREIIALYGKNTPEKSKVDNKPEENTPTKSKVKPKAEKPKVPNFTPEKSKVDNKPEENTPTKSKVKPKAEKPKVPNFTPEKSKVDNKPETPKIDDSLKNIDLPQNKSLEEYSAKELTEQLQKMGINIQIEPEEFKRDIHTLVSVMDSNIASGVIPSKKFKPAMLDILKKEYPDEQVYSEKEWNNWVNRTHEFVNQILSEKLDNEEVFEVLEVSKPQKKKMNP